MQASEIIDYLTIILTNTIPLEEYKYNDLTKGMITEKEYFKNDKELSSLSIAEIIKICKDIFQLSTLLLNKLGNEFEHIDKDLLLSETIPEIFNKTNLHSSKTAQLCLNFEKLENWANLTLIELNEFKKEDFEDCLTNSLILSFSENNDILIDILNNKNIIDSNESKKQFIEILDNIENFKNEDKNRLDKLIKHQIASKISNNLKELNYQWYKKLTNQELEIQRYDQLKQHPLFTQLF